MVQAQTGDVTLTQGGDGTWTGANGIAVTTTVRGEAVAVRLSAPSTPIKRVRLRWRGDLSSTRQILGDAWERGYGDLEWRGWIPDRVMPWYAATHDGAVTNAYGVRTGARALCFWQIDPQGISLWADVRSGGVGVELSTRVVHRGLASARAVDVGEARRGGVEIGERDRDVAHPRRSVCP